MQNQEGCDIHLEQAPLNPQERFEQDENRCQMCFSNNIEEEYHLKLCRDCRDKLVARPIPIWIKAVSVLLVLLLLFALIRFPAIVQAHVHYKKGVRAEQELRYMTAAQNFQIASEQFPKSTDLLIKLFKAYYYDLQIDKADEVLQQIVGRKVSDETAAELNSLVGNMVDFYYMDEELSNINRADLTLEKRIEQLREYVDAHPSIIVGQYLLANSLYDIEQYDEVEELILRIQESTTDYNSANLLLAAAYREKGEFERAKNEVRKVLDKNRENAGAYYTLSRIELKNHEDEQGLTDALTAYQLTPNVGYVIANLALAYHYNQNMTERDRWISLLKGREDYGKEDLEKLESIIQGETAWRSN